MGGNREDRLVANANPLGGAVTAQLLSAETLNGFEFQQWGAEGLVAAHPSVGVDLPPGLKILGGGAAVHWTGQGNMLTAMYPAYPSTWWATAKDHIVSDPAPITAVCIAAEVPDADYAIVRRNSPWGPAPTAEASVPEGFVLTGGGARVKWRSGDGCLLCASFPKDERTWKASAKDHINPSPGTVTSFAIGVSKRFLQKYGLTADRFSATDGPTNLPSATAGITSSGDSLATGGGAEVNWTGVGNMLTYSLPDGWKDWTGRSKDHLQADPAEITAWVIALFA